VVLSILVKDHLKWWIIQLAIIHKIDPLNIPVTIATYTNEELHVQIQSYIYLNLAFQKFHKQAEDNDRNIIAYSL